MMSDRHMIEKLGKTITTTKSEIIASCAGQGSRKRLYLRVYHDGSTVVIVEFVVEDHGKEEAYTTFDGAVEAYNAAL